MDNLINLIIYIIDYFKFNSFFNKNNKNYPILFKKR